MRLPTACLRGNLPVRFTCLLGLTRPAKEYPPVGAVPPVSGLPQEWLDKLKSATIANVPVSTPVVGTDNAVTYPTGTNLQSPEVCAFTTGCTRADDIFGLPEGIFGVSTWPKRSSVAGC